MKRAFKLVFSEGKIPPLWPFTVDYNQPELLVQNKANILKACLKPMVLNLPGL